MNGEEKDGDSQLRKLEFYIFLRGCVETDYARGALPETAAGSIIEEQPSRSRWTKKAGVGLKHTKTHL